MDEEEGGALCPDREVPRSRSCLSIYDLEHESNQNSPKMCCSSIILLYKRLHASVTLQWSRIFLWTLPQMCGFDTNLFLSSTDCSFDPRAWFCSDCSDWPFIKMCVSFQIIPIQLNLPQVNSTQSLVTPTSNMNAPEINSNCSRYGCEYLCNGII